MDTQNFSFKPGKDILRRLLSRRKGADSTIIHQLFQEEAEVFINRVK